MQAIWNILTTDLGKKRPTVNRAMTVLVRGLLLVTAYVSIILWADIYQYVKVLFYAQDEVREYISPVILGLPVFFMLWMFRTWDTRDKIEKSDAQMQQGKFLKGIDKLVSKNLLSILVGTEILIKVSDQTDAFDEEIRFAFIERLQDLPDNLTAHLSDGDLWDNNPDKIRDRISIWHPQITYTPKILQWLVDNPKEENDSIWLTHMLFYYIAFKRFHERGQESYEIKLSEIKRILDDKTG